MFLQVNIVRANNRIYRYVRLVRSYRKHGVSTKQVLANLGDLPPLMIENLRVALEAGRQGKSVVLADVPGGPAGAAESGEDVEPQGT